MPSSNCSNGFVTAHRSIARELAGGAVSSKSTRAIEDAQAQIAASSAERHCTFDLRKWTFNTCSVVYIQTLEEKIKAFEINSEFWLTVDTCLLHVPGETQRTCSAFGTLHTWAHAQSEMTTSCVPLNALFCCIV